MDFRNATGHWKLKVKGIKKTPTQFDFKADLIEIKTRSYEAVFTFRNGGSLTAHLVSLWIENSTHHQRFGINVYLNSGETWYYVSTTIYLPNGTYIAKVVSERGNIAVYSEG